MDNDDFCRWSRLPRQELLPSDLSEPAVSAIRAAISSSTDIIIDYQEGTGERLFLSKIRVSPKVVYRKTGHVYFDGFSYLHDEERTFRVDRIAAFHRRTA